MTAGNSSGIADGAAALLIMSAEKAFKMGIKPMAKLIGYDYHWCEPELMGYGPIYAVRSALHKVWAELDKGLDLVELNPFLDNRGETANLMVDLTASLMGRRVFDRPTRSFK